MSSRSTLTAISLALIGAVVSGCSTTAGNKPFSKKEYFQPQNFHQETGWIPDNVRRVAVLPVNTVHTDHITTVMHRQVDLFVGDAIASTEFFEIVRVSPKQLKALTGQHYWSADAALPEGFFDILRERLDCEAVMFSDLTVFRPYRPVTIGWKLHLVDAREPKILWASDVVFNSGDPTVANSAIRFSEENLSAQTSSSVDTILQSPSQFGKYTLAASFGTLQGRTKN